MKVIAPLACIAAVGLLAGCAGFTSAPVVPPQGFFYTNTNAPLDVQFDKTDLGSKQGTASSFVVLGMVAWGDASIQAAARSAGIKVIKAADYNSYNVLMVYGRYTTIVYGD
jgi:hypothetical protein